MSTLICFTANFAMETSDFIFLSFWKNEGGGTLGPQKLTNFRWPEVHFEQSVDRCFNECQHCFTAYIAMETSVFLSINLGEGAGSGGCLGPSEVKELGP